MCGRYVLEPDAEEHFFENFGAGLSDELFPNGVVSYNIAPTHAVPALLVERGQRVVKPLHWGLIPAWAKDRMMASKMINARSETVHEKPSYRQAFKQRRCVVPASGWYEWRRPEKTPFYFVRADDEPLAFAGLWEEWIDRESGEIVSSCTILTQEVNESLAAYHHRMPTVVGREATEAWLDEGFELSGLEELLKASAASHFKGYEVAKMVGRVSENHAGLIEPHIVRDLFS